MRFVLSERYALRGWKGLSYLLYNADEGRPHALTPLEFSLCMRCDGVQDVDLTDETCKLLKKGVIHPAQLGETLPNERAYKCYDVPYFSGASFSPTARCNFNCKHCFMARDENPNAAELTKTECFDIFKQLRDCGILELRFTGGEPLLHPDFDTLLLTAHQMGFRVREILTNGSLLTMGLLDRMREVGLNPLIMVSFDGLGCHDWLRGVPGAEQKALAAIEQCVSHGFPVSVHVCVHRENTSVMIDTAKRLSAMGVEVMRVIRTSESPRWVNNAGNATLTPDEYFAFAGFFLREYLDAGLTPMLELWGMLRWYPRERTVQWLPEPCVNEKKLNRLPVCTSMRSVIQIAADGSVFPCNIVSGAMRARGFTPPNIKQRPLRELLGDDAWISSVYPTLETYFAHNPDCAVCPSRFACQAGCRAIAYAVSGDYLSRDPMRCVYFRNGWAERIREVVTSRLG